jgi:AcrR family transcriptional regulator
MRKGEETREKILMRAARLFNEKGYFGASLTDIMRATGLQKGGLYNHFESKEQLALEAFDFAMKAISRRFEEGLAGKTNAADRLVAMLAVFCRNATDPPVPGGCIIMNTAIESDDAHPALRDRARKAMDQWRANICRIVKKGIQNGEIRSNVDPEQVASLVIGGIEGGVMLSKLYRDPVHLFRAAEHLTRYIEADLRRAKAIGMA